MSQEGDVNNEMPLAVGQENLNYDANSTNAKGI